MEAHTSGEGCQCGDDVGCSDGDDDDNDACDSHPGEVESSGHA